MLSLAPRFDRNTTVSPVGQLVISRRLDALVSAIGLFAIGYLLWPPDRVYWFAVAEVIGITPTMILLFSIATVIGATITTLTDVSLGTLAVGGAMAYLVGMWLIETTYSPSSPVHLLLYAGLLCCLLVGSAIGQARADYLEESDSADRE